MASRSLEIVEWQVPKPLSMELVLRSVLHVPMTTTTRTLRIHRRPDGRFVTEGENPGESPLGVDGSLGQAIGTAVREAIAMSRMEHCRVIIAVEKPNGRYQQEQIINPPVIIRRNPRHTPTDALKI
jgi:hypothetical protein